MPELPNRVDGEIIEAEHMNDATIRSIQRYTNTAQRDSLNPAPETGQPAWIVDIAELHVWTGTAWIVAGTGVFLPLTGGIVTGTLTVQDQLTANQGVDVKGQQLTNVGDPAGNASGMSRLYADGRYVRSGLFLHEFVAPNAGVTGDIRLDIRSGMVSLVAEFTATGGNAILGSIPDPYVPYREIRFPAGYYASSGISVPDSSTIVRLLTNGDIWIDGYVTIPSGGMLVMAFTYPQAG